LESVIGDHCRCLLVAPVVCRRDEVERPTEWWCRPFDCCPNHGSCGDYQLLPKWLCEMLHTAPCRAVKMYYCPPMAPAPPLRRKRSTSVCRRYSGTCSDKPLSLPAGMIHGVGLRATIRSVYQRCWAAVIPTKCPKMDNPRSGCAAPVASHADHNPLPRNCSPLGDRRGKTRARIAAMR
jgi:hypothetical protein